jgi:peptidoglycan hydrolase-like protein with peptidoglycan-binding domain
MITLSMSLTKISEENIVDLHAALTELELTVAGGELSARSIGETTIDAIKIIQKRNDLTADGELDAQTLVAINTELFDVHHTLSKTRTARLHELLERLGCPVSSDEVRSRTAGLSTRKAVESFQRRAGLTEDGKLSEQVLAMMHEEAIKMRYSTRTQIGKLQATLQKVASIAKLGIEIAPDELEAKTLGETSAQLLKAFQQKYALPATGVLNKATLDKLTSVAAGKGTYVKKLKPPRANRLKVITRDLRLNKVSPGVAELQKALSFLGYKIAEKEYKTESYGKTTARAVKMLQTENGIFPTGQLDRTTRDVLNRSIVEANPEAVPRHRYRVRGSVRDEYWRRKNQMVVKIYEKQLDKGSAEPLAAKQNFLNGFFDIPYDAPINPVNGRVKENFHLEVKLYDANDQENPVAVQLHYNVNPIHWVNFTANKTDDGELEYNGKYEGEPDYETTRAVLQKAVGGAAIEALTETATDKQITRLSLQTGLSTDDIMIHVLSKQVCAHLALSQTSSQTSSPETVEAVTIPQELSAEVIYAFLRQNLPADLPADLLRSAGEWETIDQLVELIASGIVFLGEAVQRHALESAIRQNLVSQKVKLDQDAIMQALQQQRIHFTLTRPILVGNGSLKALLDQSGISEENYPLATTVFIANKGINEAFWEEMETHEDILGAGASADLKTLVEIGNIAMNHMPTVIYLKGITGDETVNQFKRARDIAKLDQGELIALINQNNKQVPDNMPGDVIDDKVANYAGAMKQRAELLYPAAALVAEIKKSNTTRITRIAEVEDFIDQQEDWDFRGQNIDKYLLDHPATAIDAETKEELKIIQRIYKLTADASAGSALIDEGLHSSMQIYFMGKERLTAKMEAKGVEAKQIHYLYEASKTQYMQILARLTDLRREFHADTPGAITPHTYTKTEILDAVGDIPDLETLFGTLDYCDCRHCRSLYGPAAYLTDMLRFLSEHPAIEQNKTVKDILFERRPDLGNIKLNCANTDRPLPYIDLVCEILENYLTGDTDFVYQTTQSPEELRAAPQYVQTGAYTILAEADYPMNESFNLWREETRTYLDYLRVPRHELMEAFQDKADINNKTPGDAVIAAEYFGISSREKDLILTERQTAADQDKYWGFDTTQTEVPVSEFMKKTKLDYYEVLELLMVKYVNDPAAPPVSKVERPVDTCDTAQQTVVHLTLLKYDRMHRFIRLWRKVGNKAGWKMWELDLLVRSAKIGNNAINGDTLVNLKHFKQQQEKLGLPFEAQLAFFGEINREIRVDPVNPGVIIQPLYNSLFQDPAVTNPVDSYFKAVDDNHEPIPLDNGIELGENAASPYNGYTPVPTILSALALRQTDFDLLVDKTDFHLSVESLSILFRYVNLARGLRLSIPALLMYQETTGKTDPFLTAESVRDAIDGLEQIKTSGLSLSELDYIVNYRPDSPVGLREESLFQLIDALRKIQETNKEKIAQLQLSTAQLNDILTFPVGALGPMDNTQLAAALAPFIALLNTAVVDFTAAAFSVEETNFIINFDAVAATPGGKAELVENIDALQQNLETLLNQNKNQIKAQAAASFGLTDQQAAVLLESLTVPPAPETLLQILEDESLTAKDTDGNYTEINRPNYPQHYNAYTLLHKVSLLVTRMTIDTKDLEWFMENHAAVSTLNFSALPVTAAVSPNDYGGWFNLHQYLGFKSKYPEPEGFSIRSILDTAKDPAKTKEEIFDEIAGLTQWDPAEISVLDEGLKYQHGTGHLDYTDADLYRRMQECFGQMKRTGVGATAMFAWAVIPGDTAADMETAVQTRQAVKAKYRQEEWLQKVTPLHNTIREKKRTALVEYHLENSRRNEPAEIQFDGKTIPNPLYWEDGNALFKYFLIDVEMSACQLTSRIKQALSSVQLFVQRCFLNLENRYVRITQENKEDKSSPNAWSQWKWMKHYRIWEANRKVFFYPENWLEPELRDDKSVFFKELENELLQNEITAKNVDAAYHNYLQKVAEVSFLDVCGLYHQMEDLDPSESGYETNRVHVVGRTKAIPHIYYYRTYDMNYGTWSAWEKIDVEITGEHVVPVVYNRKLHLFWLQFMEKPLKSKKNPAAPSGNGPTHSPEPLKVIEIQLGWTIKKPGGWTPGKISREKLVHPWERPHYSYNLKPYYSAKTNDLYMDIYLSTSKEFNDGLFYDPNKKYNPGSASASYKNPAHLTGIRFSETHSPWHSSSFVFNGTVRDVKLKGLTGSYRLNNPFGIVNDSYDYVHQNFGADGAAIKELDYKHEYGPRLKLPNGMHYHNNRLTNNRKDSKNDRELRVLEYDDTETLLSGAESPFELVITQQDLQLNTIAASHPFFYQDRRRVFFIRPEWEVRLNNNKIAWKFSWMRKYRFKPFYHPYTQLFIREHNREGMDGLLNRRIQSEPEAYEPKNDFNFGTYKPSQTVTVDKTAQADTVDFTFGGANAMYNWELFFHAPLLIANRLTQNRKFEDAMHWYHYIFNPTDIEDYPTPQRYWVTRPFFEYNSDDYRLQRIESILSGLHLKENEDQLNAWRNNPFKPHVIARYRPVAYQKNVVMKYLDNLIAWGDMLFRRDSIESINEATLLYMLAYEILGKRPVKVPHVRHEELTYNELETKLDEFGNAAVEVIVEDTLQPVTVVSSSSGGEPIPKLETNYFCIPNNTNLGGYWDTVEDRLFKIRHCMNIRGVERQLPLFEPPIDPALLVKAAAAGMDLSSVLDELSVPTPYYRFGIVVQKALDFCSEVKALGEKLQAALEKKDVEALSLLRSRHEIELQEAVKDVRRKQVDETQENIRSLNKAFEIADEKKNYYESRDFMNAWEGLAMGLHGISAFAETALAITYTVAGGFAFIPDFIMGGSGFGGSPHSVSKLAGGDKASKATEYAAQTMKAVATSVEKFAGLSSTMGTYNRRQDEWDFQGRLATIEKAQIRYQVNAAEIRKAIAEKELENQELQIEQFKAANDYMRNKYTNEQLYSWMITQISTVYFQAYQLAFDMAKKAERCYRYELGISDSNIIQFGYWDSLKKGLLSGDRLMTDLRRLEAEYINRNRREFEITKHISLAQMAPLSLIMLKETGHTTISLPEWLFDMDYPGHYMRRIKNVSLSIPCVTGPYTGVNCTLSLLKNETRMETTLAGDLYDKHEDDTRFKTVFGAITSIATSSAQNDSGMFELNFNDERYLPFEGAGVISDWGLSMPIENNYFDFGSLSDVVLHISYTSRGGGGQLAVAANEALQDKLPSQTARLFSLKHEFGTEWHKFLYPSNGTEQEFVAQLKSEHYPFFIRGKIETLKIKAMEIFVESKSTGNISFIADVQITTASTQANIPIDRETSVNNVHHTTIEYPPPSDPQQPQPNALGEIRLKLQVDSMPNPTPITSAEVEDIYVLFQLEKAGTV